MCATPAPGGSPDVGFEAKGTMRGRVTLVLASVWIAAVGYRAPFAAPQGAPAAPRPTVAPARAATAPSAPSASQSSQQAAVLKQYCLTCHSDRLKTGGLTLESLDLTNLSGHAETWEKVVRRLRTGSMPPVGV